MAKTTAITTAMTIERLVEAMERLASAIEAYDARQTNPLEEPTVAPTPEAPAVPAAPVSAPAPTPAPTPAAPAPVVPQFQMPAWLPAQTVPITCATANPAAAVPVPAPAPAPAPAPIPTPAPMPSGAPTYAVEDLMRAGGELLNLGKNPGVLLQQFGVQAVTQLKPEQYGAFATALRQMGARI